VKRFRTAAALAALLSMFAGTSLSAQARRGGPPAVDGEGSVTPGDVQKMFDAYALMQAQQQLNIGDEQFTRFLTRFKALQEIRRQAQQERARIIMNLRRLTATPPGDEVQIKERLSALQEIDTRAAADVKKAYDGIDQVLDLRQQAQFRVFEELMERRKLELVMRARQANRQKLRRP
jgi:Spy/CpxP family protein refolding chaperone